MRGYSTCSVSLCVCVRVYVSVTKLAATYLVYNIIMLKTRCHYSIDYIFPAPFPVPGRGIYIVYDYS